MRKFLILACLVPCLATQASAQDLFVRPQECERVATAQYNDCQVDNHFICNTIEGRIARLESSTDLGLDSVESFNEATLTRELAFIGTTGNLRIVEAGGTELDAVRDGESRSDFSGEFQFFGMWRPVTGSVVMRHTGEEKELAGTDFKVVEAELTVIFPYPATPVTGIEAWLFDPESNLSVTFESRVISGIPDTEPPTQLMELSLPGQPGFGTEIPRFGCASLSFDDLSAAKTPA